ncbi:MAG: radical SAM family heme chaperone HemW [Acidimicrobiales bacterium]
MGSYAHACRAEVVAATLPPATSVFFGGGTPSLLPPSLLVSILDAVEVVENAEITVECNPDTVTSELLDTYIAGGVNRLSFGVQSMADHVLSGLGRTHRPGTVADAVNLARRAGFERYNLDVIYGGAGETDADWKETLSAVLALGASHVSAYALTVEPGTPLAGDSARHPDDDVQAERYLTADAVLGEAGLRNYEISNWAVPGHECRHNLLYWSQGDYRGIGCAAHSHQAGRRWWNVRTPERYIGLIAKARSAQGGSETLDSVAREIERLQLAVRTRSGVPVTAFASADLATLVERGLIATDGDRAILTPEGRLLANEVSVRLRPVGAGDGSPCR